MACIGWLALSAADAEPLEQLDRCIAQVDAEKQSLDAVRAVCPDLDATLEALGYTELLCSECGRRFGRETLQDLRALAARYSREQTRSPETSALRPVLDELARARVRKPRSWWDLLREWILSHFKDREPPSFDWLKRLLGGTASFFRIALYLLLGGVLIAAVYVVVREFRAAAPRWRKRAAIGTAKAFPTRATAYELSMRDVDAASLLDRPAILLKLLVQRLLESGRLSRERDLTHRELIIQAQFDTQTERERFKRLAQSAESVLYGGNDISTDVERAVADGRALFEGITLQGERRK